MPMILAGDIGGTKTELALFNDGPRGLECVAQARYHSAGHDSLESLLTDFLHARPEATAAVGCFGVAGPVVEGVCRTTNLPWRIEEQTLAETAGLARVRLLNDVEAAAYGMLRLPDEAQVVLNAGSGSGRPGNVAVLAAGTGLGEAVLHWNGSEHDALASEGGHAGFAPNSDEEIALLRFLRTRFGGHVSCERVLSGPGLINVYEFVRHDQGAAEPAWLADARRAGEGAAAITRAALAGDDAVCARALHLFVHAFGVEAGNLALKCLALGGVFLGGGIAPKILPALQDGAFLRGFTDKGRFSNLLRGIRVSVAMDTRAPLLGAAHCAARLARQYDPNP